MSSVSTYFKGLLLDGAAPTQASLHTAFPGTTGANECSGGSYARQTIAYDPASGGIRTQIGSEAFNVNAQTVRWIGVWQGSNWLFAAPAGGGSPKNFVSRAGTDTVYSPAHGWSDGQKVVLFNGTPPGNITEGAIYFVRDADTDTFKLAATDGGVAIDLTSAPSWGCVIAAITEYAFTGSGTFTLESSQIVIPD